LTGYNFSLGASLFNNLANSYFQTCGETGRSYTFAELFDLSLRVARGLIAQTGLGLDKNEIVGVILPNIPEFAAVVYGATESGFIVTFANPLFTVDEVCRQFTNAGVKCIFTIPSMLPVSQAYQKITSNYKGTILVGGENDLPNRIMSFQVNLMFNASLLTYLFIVLVFFSVICQCRSFSQPTKD
jgi:acyl-coenzyme A synthetase/AMP-(fatty) acid ligase